MDFPLHFNCITFIIGFTQGDSSPCVPHTFYGDE